HGWLEGDVPWPGDRVRRRLATDLDPRRVARPHRHRRARRARLRESARPRRRARPRSRNGAHLGPARRPSLQRARRADADPADLRDRPSRRTLAAREALERGSASRRALRAVRGRDGARQCIQRAQRSRGPARALRGAAPPARRRRRRGAPARRGLPARARARHAAHRRARRRRGSTRHGVDRRGAPARGAAVPVHAPRADGLGGALGTLQAIWQAIGAAGGALALAFIVLLAIGLLALTALFGGAAVVVLERFARQQRRWSSTLAAWAL